MWGSVLNIGEFMKFWEIVKALEEGRSVRNKNWNDHLTIKMVDGNIKDTENFRMRLQTIFESVREGNKWEII